MGSVWKIFFSVKVALKVLDTGAFKLVPKFIPKFSVDSEFIFAFDPVVNLLNWLNCPVCVLMPDVLSRPNSVDPVCPWTPKPLIWVPKPWTPVTIPLVWSLTPKSEAVPPLIPPLTWVIIFVLVICVVVNWAKRTLSIKPIDHSYHSTSNL